METRRQLSSWKEIATYLERDLRTVQRWELERKLPVHRPPGEKRGGVFAYTDELDSWISGELGITMGQATGTGQEKRPNRRRSLYAIGVAAALGVVAVGGYLFGYGQAAGRKLEIQRLTYRRGSLRSARFRPDGRNAVYGAAWEGAPTQLFETALDRPESAPLGLDNAQLLALSSRSAMALLLNPQPRGPFIQVGSLAIRGLYGHTPEPIANNVTWADWSPDGTELVYTSYDRDKGSWIESYSLAKHSTRRIYPKEGELSDWLSHVRFSPDRKRLAFERHEPGHDDGRVVVLDLPSGTIVLSRRFASLYGLAWRRDDEVWFTATEEGLSRAIWGMKTTGEERSIYQAPGTLTIHDISKSGEVLITRDLAQSAVFGVQLSRPQDSVELSIFDWSVLGDISSDGTKVVLSETGEATRKSGLYIRLTDGAQATWLGEATTPATFSPDSTAVLALTPDRCPQIVLFPPGAPSRLISDRSLCVSRVGWLADGHSIIFTATPQGASSPRCYAENLQDLRATAILGDGYRCLLTAPKGTQVLAKKEGDYSIVDARLPSQHVAVSLPKSMTPIRWLGNDEIVASEDLRPLSLKVLSANGRQARDLATLRAPAGLDTIFTIRISSERRTAAFSGYRLLSDLYLIKGFRE